MTMLSLLTIKTKPQTFPSLSLSKRKIARIKLNDINFFLFYSAYQLSEDRGKILAVSNVCSSLVSN